MRTAWLALPILCALLAGCINEDELFADDRAGPGPGEVTDPGHEDANPDPVTDVVEDELENVTDNVTDGNVTAPGNGTADNQTDDPDGNTTGNITLPPREPVIHVIQVVSTSSGNTVFSPEDTELVAGDAILLTNHSPNLHQFYTYPNVFRTGAMREGDAYSVELHEPGTIKVRCSYHREMETILTITPPEE